MATTVTPQLVRLQNKTAKLQQVWLEPLGERVPLQPNVLYELSVSDEFGNVEIDLDDDGFVVYGWVTRIERVDDEGSTCLEWRLPVDRSIAPSLDWHELVSILVDRVPVGCVTTYAEVSRWGYGVPNRNQPVRALLVRAWNGGHRTLTNRVVKADGSLAALPGGMDQQRKQLVSEGVPFKDSGKVDFTRITPVSLMN
ncbi:MAG TPA: hypothetical protein VHZ24_11305 [Pirellulales bacterium]|jgi:alkylated DNA nucleotide flippase Atl1|nr:hypothetical protein [Pirellulales bacterium]